MSIYEDLSAPFAQTFTDTRGGVTFTYITGEQVASRLNDVLGVENWSFSVREHGLNTEADEYWVLGMLAAEIDGSTATRQQFGSQKVRRSSRNGEMQDIGSDLKGATTDAFKKCATLLGVGLYLSHKEGRAAQPKRQPSQPRPAPNTPQVVHPGVNAKVADVPFRPPAPPPLQPDIYCIECGQLVEPVVKKDGGTMTAKEITDLSQKTFERLLCGDCFKIALAAKNAVGRGNRVG